MRFKVPTLQVTRKFRNITILVNKEFFIRIRQYETNVAGNIRRNILCGSRQNKVNDAESQGGNPRNEKAPPWKTRIN